MKLAVSLQQNEVVRFTDVDIDVDSGGDVGRASNTSIQLHSSMYELSSKITFPLLKA